MSQKVVLVCGSRNFEDYFSLGEVLEGIHKETPITMIIQGGANGADSLAGDWAYENYIPCLRVPANWPKYKKSAGHIRNQQMLTYNPDLVVAFPLAESRGTFDMIRRAEKEGIEVLVIEQ